MEKFILTPTYIIEGNSEVNVCLRPSNELIDDYIATYRGYINEEEALADKPLFIE